MLTLAFHPVDTWFFRESRPMDSQGGTSLGNQVPPSAATLMGALRTRIGDMLEADWQDLTTLPVWWGGC
ncbi:type III-B CRISPR module-associated Cmr3 family protein [Aeromonas veronii]|uniref:type III-B CRISPR module-associated Cmr3 family protein n=1 Tax=Aeromonas veronii TaxID=654 RepID=UPI0024444B51|nr:type III-B CRISPR module-associated Cmr3 family protein [Aeromonas veronii]